MKNNLHFQFGWVLVFLCAFNLGRAQENAKKQNPVDTAECLEITGEFDESVKYMVGTYTVKLIKDNKVVEKLESKVKKPFKIILHKNMHYTIKIEKEGFISRLFSVDTKLSSKIEVEDLFKFNFQFNLLSEDLYNHFDDDDMDFPLALISYNSKCDCFKYDEKYTTALMARIVNALLYGS